MANAATPFCVPLPQTYRRTGTVTVACPVALQLADPQLFNPRILSAVERLNDHLHKADSGAAVATTLSLTLTVGDTTDAVPQQGDEESYKLRVSESGVQLEAATDWGLLHGLETLLQLLLAAEGTLVRWQVSDQPRFGWRGLLLDVARHFLSLETLQRTVDCMAAVKLNVLHLHLSDDQGFRFTSTAFPKLASTAAYSTAELTALVAYAADRGIRVVPELDMPGHVTSWLLAYPQWGTEPVDASNRFGVHEATLNPTDEAVYQALETLLTELAAVFPDRYVHIGGDEVHPAQWQRSEVVQAYMRSQQLADLAALQAHFNGRVRAILDRLGKRMLVWDEALHPTLATGEPAVVVQNWRGATTRDRALSAGHPIIVSSGYYLDLHYPARWHYLFDPGAPQAALLAHEDALLEQPEFAGVAEGMRWTHQWRQGALSDAPLAGAAPVLGGEACLWGELVDEASLDVRLWGRMPAVAERFWSAQGVRDCDDMYRRVEQLLSGWASIDRNNLAHRSAQGLQAAGISGHWQELLQWFEPVKWYGRLLGQQALEARISGAEMPKARPYQVTTPLNKVIDHLPVESLVSRDLAAAAQRGDVLAIEQTVLDWQALLARNDAPPTIDAQRAALSELLTLVKVRLSGAQLSAGQRQSVAQLQKPASDLLLMPAFVLSVWLLGESQ